MSTYEISKSSLLSLKAEVLRKQEEVNKAKLQNKFRRKHEPKKLTPLEVKNKGVEKREAQDLEDVDEDILQKSKKTLEQKAKLYQKLCKPDKKLTSEENEYVQRLLVHFDKKQNEDNPFDNEEEEISETNYEPAENPDEEWVEYIDCLGRTRTCMKKDLEFLKSKDADLRASVENDPNKNEQLQKQTLETSKETEEKLIDENNELLSADMRREIMRRQWEKEEAELAKKDNIHYQDILFNEARTHGVGYYAFSKDEAERARQQEDLLKLRKETEQEQKKAQQLKLQRDKLLAARIRAAKNRKRARLGLPPEEENEEQEVEEVNNLDKEKEEEEKRKQEELEKEKIQKNKEAHIRPWDIGKEGVKEHYVYSQEEWVEKKRDERLHEFAPPQQYSRSNFRSFDKHQSNEEEIGNKNLYFSSKKDQYSKKDKFKSSNPYKSKEPEEIQEKRSSEDKNEFEKYPRTVETPKSSSAAFEPTLIVNECSDSEPDEDRLMNDYNVISSSSKNDNKAVEELADGGKKRKGVEIAPPPTFEYYGPSDGPKKTKVKEKKNIEEAISAGLKFLRNQFENKKKTNSRDSEMFIM